MNSQPTIARRGPLLVVAALLVVVVAAGGAWYLFLRPAGPAPVTLTDASSSAAVPAAALPSSPAAVAQATGTAPAGDGIAGTWTVDPSVGLFDDFSGSFVGYRVRETLATIGATEAVGRTPDVTGSLTVDGSTVTAATFTADLTELRSDDDRRDGQLRRQALETGQFPSATFVLTSPIELGSEPQEGATLDLPATGDLTLHGATRAVTIPLQARLRDGVVTVAGSLPIAFADFGIARPASMIVLSVENTGVMEVQLQLTRS